MAFAFLLPEQIEGDRCLIGDEYIIACRIAPPQSGQYGTCADFSSNGLVLEEFHSQLSAGKPVGSLQNSEFHRPHIVGRGTPLTDMQHRNDDFRNAAPPCTYFTPAPCMRKRMMEFGT